LTAGLDGVGVSRVVAAGVSEEPLVTETGTRGFGAVSAM